MTTRPTYCYPNADRAMAAIGVLHDFGIGAGMMETRVLLPGGGVATEWEVTLLEWPPAPAVRVVEPEPMVSWNPSADPDLYDPQPHEDDHQVSSWWDEDGPGYFVSTRRRRSLNDPD